MNTSENLITIFIPVYNGEKYLIETLTSIQNQSYTHFEVLLVDDSSIDSSLSLLQDFAKDDNRFKVFSKANGGSVACSWNYIMPEIKGDFVFYASQDDLLSQNLLEEMITRQQNSKADCVVPDMEFYYEKRDKNEQIVGLNGNREVIISGKEALIESLDWNIHGFVLIRTPLLSDEVFPEDAFDTDELMTRKLFLKSNTVAFSKGVFYYRQDNSNAITKTFSSKNFYTLNTLLRLLNLLQENDIPKKHLINLQHIILLKYIHYSALWYSYHFKSPQEKEESRLFLQNFRTQLNSHFYGSTLLTIVGSLKTKTILLLLICNVKILYQLVTKLYITKMKKEFNIT